MRFFPPIVLAIITAALVAVSCSANNFAHRGQKDISPYYYGLAKAKTGVERYEVLLKTHQEAVKVGVNVNYKGIDVIEMEIPKNAKPIPLTEYNDFCGTVLRVKNTQKNLFLFRCVSEMEIIPVRAWQIDNGDFSNNKLLRKGKYILSISDKNPWVENRKGYSYGAARKDILFIKNGKAQNRPVAEYNNQYSEPEAMYCRIDGGVVVKNLSLVRDSSSTEITRLLLIDGKNDVLIQDVTLKTPESDLTGDRAICVNNSTNVRIEDITIDGTYSLSNKYGYGISLDNVWNVTFSRLVADGNWGVFGNNNVNNCTLDDCRINRFDVHCYGRDIFFNTCSFLKLYNQFSSVFGKVVFNQCEFKDFVPVLIEQSYNAYTEFDLTFNECIFYTTKEKNYLINTGSLSGGNNSRHELSVKKLPKVHVNNLKAISLETGKEEKEVQLFLKRGRFIEERNIKNVIKLF